MILFFIMPLTILKNEWIKHLYDQLVIELSASKKQMTKMILKENSLSVQHHEKQEIVVVWFKRDLRFTDHAPLYYAQKQKLPILLIYCFEPSVMAFHDSDVRHWRFVHQSLQDMQEKLNVLSAQLYTFHKEVPAIFSALNTLYTIRNVFSHEEIGNKLTYDRDKTMQSYFDSHL
jgi:deoxyribodipyrimidine photolyase